MTRRIVRTTLAAALTLYVWAALTAIATEAAGWQLLGLTAGLLLAIVTTLLMRRNA
ncbi:hypothetical protein [Marisediminicola senii]|uniref:hypothetical protein n=1 Tax=Marisediminicola senii TaxID=2711233 RepID=UPI0013EB2791|nr:hypothetical protein [Marisediminicola senii]